MNYIEDINYTEDNNIYKMVIEIPIGTNKKFELVEPDFNKVECVRKIHGRYPFYYGCIPQTLAGDKDALDIILIDFNKEKFNSLDIVDVYPIALIKTIDNNEIDNKVIAIRANVLAPKKINKFLKIVLKFLKSYKGKKSNTIIDDYLYDANEAKKEIDICHNRYKEDKEAKSNMIQSF